MTYKVTFEKKAFKELEKIRAPHYSSIKTAIYKLADNPRPLGYRKLVDRDGYRIRVGNYRIIYNIIDDTLIINIITLGHRKDIYRQ